MAFTETLLFYLLIGLFVAAAVWLTETDRPAGSRLFPAATAVIFWPLYLPALLTPRVPHREPAAERPAAPRDMLAVLIAQVEGELDTALQSLDGWAGETLSRQRARIEELRSTWSLEAQRIRDMDCLLAAVPRADSEPPAHHAGQPGALLECPVAHGLDLTARFANQAAQSHSNERVRQSEQARLENLARLAEVRRQAYEDLTGTLAWVRELVSMIHLAKFTGAPASRAEALVAQIAAAVEGFSEVTAWPTNTSQPANTESALQPQA